jgi:hypothetical protein
MSHSGQRWAGLLEESPSNPLISPMTLVINVRKASPRSGSCNPEEWKFSTLKGW